MSLALFRTATEAERWSLNSDLSSEERDATVERLARGTQVSLGTRTPEIGEQIAINCPA